MVQAIVHELKLRKDYFGGQTVETVYFGGGTPSLLDNNELTLILKTLHDCYSILPEAEFTIECNPEDLSTEKLQSLKNIGFNRLSIGIQTFDDEILKFLNRAHNSEQAIKAVREAQKIGFQNITIDLMYALPKSSNNSLERDLALATNLDVPHISAYCFTLEEKTVFGKWEKQHKLTRNTDELEQEHYLLLKNHLTTHGYEQYEISNYARDEQYSKHNSSYWLGKHYVGVGPGAHSFNGTERQWNVSNNAIYIEKVGNGSLSYETETLTVSEQINESILIQLRTKWGLDVANLKSKFGFDFLVEKKNKIAQLLDAEFIQLTNSTIFLTEKGKLLADGIVVDLMV